MPIINDVTNALGYLARGDFKEFLFRLRVHFGKVDLRYASVNQLGLPPEKSHDYRHSGGSDLEKVLRHLKVSGADAIVDFGSGKGGALATFARFPFRKITGVELLPELVAIAKENFRILKISGVDMVVSDAAEFVELDDYNFFYFYSPFPIGVMEAVIANIATSLLRRPRRVQIIYCNPEFHEAVITGTPFRQTAEFQHQQLDLPIRVYSNQQ
jgi:tRNA1(Val) A37 N6-methylase TrmN6